MSKDNLQNIIEGLNNNLLTTVDLNNINNAGACAVADALKVNNSVTTVNLSANNISNAGACAVADALKVNNSVTTVNLSANDISNAGACAVADALKVNRSLTTVNLNSNNIGNAGAAAVADALKGNNSVTIVNLGGNQISNAGAITLAEALKVNHSLTTVDLGDNNIGAAGAITLAEALKVNDSLTTVDLGINDIGAAGAAAVADALKDNRSLTTVDLGHNNIGAAGAAAAAEALKVNCSLTTVDLRGNNISAAGACAVAEALKVNDSLTTMDLGYNNIGAAGAAAVAEALKVNDSLTTVDLGINDIGAAGAAAVAEALEVNYSLTTVDLRSNGIGENGATALAKALKVNRSLTTVDLGNNRISNAGATALAKALETSSTIITINLDRNQIGDEIYNIIQDKVKVNVEKLQLTIDHVQHFIKQVVQDKEVELSSIKPESKLLSSISLEDYKYIVEHKSYINSWLIKEIKEHKIAITANSFWQELEASRSTASLEKGIFDLLDLPPRHNAIVSNFYSYAKEGYQLYELFAAQSQSNVKEDATAPEEAQESNELIKFKEQYAAIAESDGDVTTLWEELITYAGKLLDWSEDKVTDIKVLKNIPVNKSTGTGEEQYSTINELKKAVLFHNLYPQYKDTGLVIKDYSENIVEGLKHSDASVEAYSLIRSLAGTILAEEVKEKISEILKSVYESKPELFKPIEYLETLTIEGATREVQEQLDNKESQEAVKHDHDTKASLLNFSGDHHTGANPTLSDEYNTHVLLNGENAD